jgi:hypothetical protein
MENKFKLTNVVLYAKGWYLQTDDIFEDLRKILELDDYLPNNKFDVYSILLHHVQSSNLYRWTELKEVMNGIHPHNCWKVGYYTNYNVPFFIDRKCGQNLPEYDMVTAFVYYTLSNLRNLDNTQWYVKMPQVHKYPRAKDVTINQLYKQFGKK